MWTEMSDLAVIRRLGERLKAVRIRMDMTQEDLAFVIDRTPRTIMYNENNGQHPSLNAFYQMMTMFDISVDQFFFPEKYPENSCRTRIDVMLNSLDEKDLRVIEATIQALKDAKETEEV